MKRLQDALVSANPVFVTLLGLCPSLAVTTRVSDAFSLGAVAMAVLVLGSLVTSLLRSVVDPAYRLPVTLGVLGTLASVSTLIVQLASPSLSTALGIYLPLTAVNCIITGRLQTVAWNEPPVRAMLDALQTAAGFLLALLLISVLRESLGAGTITLFAAGDFDGVIRLPWLADHPVRVMTMGAGGFILLGYLVALFRRFSERRRA
jgi:electron transport complex protein RnfE